MGGDSIFRFYRRHKTLVSFIIIIRVYFSRANKQGFVALFIGTGNQERCVAVCSTCLWHAIKALQAMQNRPDLFIHRHCCNI